MQTKKIIGIALAAALVTSMAAVAATSVSAADAKFTTLGVIGGFNDWGGDVAMTDADGDGVYEAEVTVVGDYGFKVRADGAWDYSWGVYEADHDRTQNSQTDAHATVKEGQKLVVRLDTTKVDDAAKANADSYVNSADFNFDAEGYDFWPLTFEVVDASVPTTGGDQVKPFATLGIVGGFASSDWGNKGDVAMNDDDHDGIWVGEVTDAGDYDFKVRADGKWDYSWGVYEADFDRTQNSQINSHATVKEGQKLVVKLDTTKVDPAAKAVADSYVNNDDFDFDAEGYDFWPLTFEVVSATDDTSKDDTSKDESSKDESSKDESSKDESSKDESSSGDYTTQRTDYIFFDNSKTKWDKVYAYWWNGELGETYDKLSKDKDGSPAIYPDYERDENGEIKLDEKGNKIRNPWPGLAMQKVGDTDVWQIRIPYGATNIIFSTGVKDTDLAEGNEGYQIADKISGFDAEKNKGQIFVIDTTDEAKNGRAAEKYKYRFNTGAWEAYNGEFTSEVIKGAPADTKNISAPSGSSSNASTVSKSATGTTTTTSTTSTTVDAPATGEVAMVAAFIAVATAALGAVVLAKKKRED